MIERNGKVCYGCNDEEELIKVRPCMFCTKFRDCEILEAVLEEYRTKLKWDERRVKFVR